MKARTILSLPLVLVAMLWLAPEVSPAHSQAYAGGAYLKEDFASDAAYGFQYIPPGENDRFMPGNYPVGTEYDLTLEREYVEGGDQHYVIKQYTLLSDGSSGPDIFNMVGIQVSGPTADRTTMHRGWYYFKTGAGQSQVGWSGSGNVDWYSGEPMSLYLAKSKPDSCLAICGNVRWEVRINILGNHTPLTMAYDKRERHPYAILAANHGLESHDSSAKNDIHIKTKNHKYYDLSTCRETANCASDWQSTDAIAWLSPEAHDNEALGLLTYGSSPEWEHCMGKAPGSKCACDACPAPHAYSPNRVWETGRVPGTPGPQQVVKYYVDVPSFGTGTSYTRWEEAIDESAAVFNQSGHVYLEKTNRSDDAQIKVKGSDNILAFGLANFSNVRVHNTSGWSCADPRDFETYEEVTIHINTNEALVEWTDSQVFLERAVRPPGSPHLRWIRLTGAHEFGHALFVDHHPLSCPPQPTRTPGTPPPVDPTPPVTVAYPLMCSDKPGDWNAFVTIDMHDYMDDVECVFYRND